MDLSSNFCQNQPPSGYYNESKISRTERFDASFSGFATTHLPYVGYHSIHAITVTVYITKSHIAQYYRDIIAKKDPK